MLGLTPLGVFHTAISLLAVGAGIIALIRDHDITLKNWIGKVYVISTAITCLTGFGIFQHGGFGKPHVLGIITLTVLAVAAVAEEYGSFGRGSPYVATIAYSATFFFHLVPGLTETATRLPLGAPLVSGPDAPELQKAIGIVFVAFLIGVTLQVRQMRGKAGRVTT
jgi:uncharacterized membrane protein